MAQDVWFFTTTNQLLTVRIAVCTASSSSISSLYLIDGSGYIGMSLIRVSFRIPFLQERLRINHVFTDCACLPSPVGSRWIHLVQRWSAHIVISNDEKGYTKRANTTGRGSFNNRTRKGAPCHEPTHSVCIPASRLLLLEPEFGLEVPPCTHAYTAERLSVPC